MDPMNMQGFYSSYQYPFYTPDPQFWPHFYTTPQHVRVPAYRGMSGHYQGAAGYSAWQQRFEYFSSPNPQWGLGAGHVGYNFFSTPPQSPSIPFAATPLHAARFARVDAVHAVASPVVVERGRTSRINSPTTASPHQKRARSARPAQPGPLFSRADAVMAVAPPARIEREHADRFATPPALVAVAPPVPVLVERTTRSPNTSLERIPRARSSPSRPTAREPFPKIAEPVRLSPVATSAPHPSSPQVSVPIASPPHISVHITTPSLASLPNMPPTLASISLIPPPLLSLSNIPPPQALGPSVPLPQARAPTPPPMEPGEGPKSPDPFQEAIERFAPFPQAVPETLVSGPEIVLASMGVPPFSARKTPLDLNIPGHLHHTHSPMPLPVDTGTPVTVPTVSHHQIVPSPMMGAVGNTGVMADSNQQLPMPATPRMSSSSQQLPMPATPRMSSSSQQLPMPATPRMSSSSQQLPIPATSRMSSSTQQLPMSGTPRTETGTPWRRPPTPFAPGANVPTETSLGTL